MRGVRTVVLHSRSRALLLMSSTHIEIMISIQTHPHHPPQLSRLFTLLEQQRKTGVVRGRTVPGIFIERRMRTAVVGTHDDEKQQREDDSDDSDDDDDEEEEFALVALVLRDDEEYH